MINRLLTRFYRWRLQKALYKLSEEKITREQYRHAELKYLRSLGQQ
jgi:hypothetical protein